MLIRMTGFGSTIATLLAAGALAVGGLLAGGSDEPSAHRTALVIDASAARDGRELVDTRLRDADVAVRLPSTSTEASTDVRYFAAQGYRVVVTGPRASSAAPAAGIAAERAPDLPSALAAAGR